MLLLKIQKKYKKKFFFQTLNEITILKNYLLQLKKKIVILKKNKKLKKLTILWENFLKNNNNLLNRIYLLQLAVKFSFFSKKTKNILNKIYLKKYNKFYDLLYFIVNIRFSNTNTIIIITDIKGNLKYYCTSGLIKLSGKQKKRQPTAIILLLKKMLTQIKILSNKPVALHFKNVPLKYEFLIIKLLKKTLFLKTIRSYNLQPCNGCRPKKIKRIKRKRHFFN